MTRIILIVDLPIQAYAWYDDPRPWRELVMAINTGTQRIGEADISYDGAQCACGVPEHNAVIVVFGDPEIPLTPQLYRVLWQLADGEASQDIAHHLQISMSTLYKYYRTLKDRFGVESLSEVLDRADHYGLI